MSFELNTMGWHISSVINIILLTFWAYLCPGFQAQDYSMT